jgi:hypothetical protein
MSDVRPSPEDRTQLLRLLAVELGAAWDAAIAAGADRAALRRIIATRRSALQRVPEATPAPAREPAAAMPTRTRRGARRNGRSVTAWVHP